jgi:DNA repair protein RecO (recombination protein O)
MPQYATDALILRTYKLGESDRIVVFLTRDRGKKRGVAKNARQSRRRFGGGLEPMTCGRVGYVERERRDLVLLNYVEPTRSPLSAVDQDALGYVGYFAELLDECAPEADPNEALFRLGASTVEAMAGGVPIEPLARYFEYWLLRLQGVYRPDPKASSDARAFLEAARTCSPFALGGVAATRGALRELETAHRAQLTMHLEKDLRSVRVLKEIERSESQMASRKSHISR